MPQPRAPAPATATLDELRRQHRLLDAEIDRSETGPGAASTQIKELKRRRLELRDHIARLERSPTQD